MTQEKHNSISELSLEAEILSNDLKDTCSLLLTLAIALEIGSEESGALCACERLVEGFSNKASFIASELYSIAHKTKASDILGARAAKEED